MVKTIVGTNIRRIFNGNTFPPITLKATTLLMVIVLTAVVAAGTLARQTDDQAVPDPFIRFTGLFPGHGVDTGELRTQGFSCYDDMLPTPADISERCTQTLPDGVFSDINLTVWDGVVKWLDLKVRDNNLDVGTLSLHWGSPEIRVDGNWVNLSWPDHHAIGLGWTYNKRFTYFQVLSHITFAV